MVLVVVVVVEIAEGGNRGPAADDNADAEDDKKAPLPMDFIRITTDDATLAASSLSMSSARLIFDC